MTDLVVKRISFRGRKFQGEGMKLDKNRFETYFHFHKNNFLHLYVPSRPQFFILLNKDGNLYF